MGMFSENTPEQNGEPQFTHDSGYQWKTEEPQKSSQRNTNRQQNQHAVVRDAANNSSHKTLFGNYLTKDYIQKRVSSQYGSATTNTLNSDGGGDAQLSESLINQAKSAAQGGNSIMINTGPVTSHTVLLNLFQSSTQPHAEVEKKKSKLKQQQPTFSFNEDMKRMKRVYGGGGQVQKQNSTTSAATSDRKLIVGSTVLSRDKHRHIKYAVTNKGQDHM